ncbi:hypothetical protein PoB_005090200 [Plakobranchus ocellatus]|uniref:Uncharacterized protein n=1 Tax=Plakobranchus ocellatus TaxID=259542 RepID=A0AAV4BZ53_9GAST|nr:hypothetical protein PoB_005090200 [Plakobranchus ocellatus]
MATPSFDSTEPLSTISVQEHADSVDQRCDSILNTIHLHAGYHELTEHFLKTDRSNSKAVITIFFFYKNR